MPFNPYDFPPIIERSPSAEVKAWKNLRSLLDKKMDTIRGIRDKEDIKKADLAQTIMLKEFPISECEMWEDMFDQGRLRGLSATNAIINTRESLNTLTSPILTKEQDEEEERMYELRQLLEKVLKKIDELENCDSKITVSKKVSVDLMEQAELYVGLAHSSKEGKNLVQKVIENIGELARLINERQNG